VARADSVETQDTIAMFNPASSYHYDRPVKDEMQAFIVTYKKAMLMARAGDDRRSQRTDL
jgi:hypothetical protein